jgi:hypothetical protein
VTTLPTPAELVRLPVQLLRAALEVPRALVRLSHLDQAATELRETVTTLRLVVDRLAELVYDAELTGTLQQVRADLLPMLDSLRSASERLDRAAEPLLPAARRRSVDDRLLADFPVPRSSRAAPADDG